MRSEVAFGVYFKKHSDVVAHQKLFRSILCFVIFSAISFWLSLTIVPVYQVSEAREGTVIAEMLRSGNWALPLRNNFHIPSKPPLFHWIGAALSAVLPFEKQVLLRMPSFLFALGMLGTVLVFTARCLGIRTALTASLVLVSSYGFLRLGSDGRVDMVFCFFVTAAIFVWLAGWFDLGELGEVRTISNRIYLFVALLSGMSVLAKGPLGLVLVLLVLAGVTIAFEGVRSIRHLIRLPWVFALLIPLPWYLLALDTGGEDFMLRQFVFENLSRFVGAEGITEKPFWFYLPHIFSQAMPWTPLLVVCASALLPTSQGRKQFLQMFSKLSLNEVKVVKVCALWFLLVLVFLSLSFGKRRGYLLAVLPPLSILMAVVLPIFWSQLQEVRSRQRVQKVASFVLFGMWAVIILFGVFLFSSTSLLGQAFSGKEFVGELSSVVAAHWWPIGILGAIFVLPGIVLLRRYFESGRSVALFFSFICLTQTVFCVYLPACYAAKAEARTYRAFAAELDSFIPRAERLFVFKKPSDESLDALFYHFPRTATVLPLTTKTPPSGYVLVQEKNLEVALKNKIVAPQISPILVGGKGKVQRVKDLLLFSSP